MWGCVCGFFAEQFLNARNLQMDCCNASKGFQMTFTFGIVNQSTENCESLAI